MSENQYIVGITGYAQSGKSTVAEELVKNYGFVHINFADTLREMALAINPPVDFIYSKYHGSEPFYYSDAMQQFGYEESKRKFPEFRRFLQRLGTEGGRRVLGDSLWVDKWEEKAKAALLAGNSVVASDVRFHNEANKIRSLMFERSHGGNEPFLFKEIWRVSRPGVGPQSEHSSEKEMESIEADRTFENDKDLKYLETGVILCHLDMTNDLKAFGDRLFSS